MSEENHKTLKDYLHKHSPCLLEAVRLAEFIFANTDEDDKYDLAFIVMDYIHGDCGIPIESIASQCFYTSRDTQDFEFASATLYWLQVQNEIGFLGVDEHIEATNDRDAARVVADQTRGAAGSGDIGRLVAAFVSRGVVEHGTGM